MGEAHGKRLVLTYRCGYDLEQVDAFLDQAELRLAARESRAAAGRSTVAVEVQKIKLTTVYESMFGNTHKVAQAISDGVREAHPHADVECVAVGRASPELIKSTDPLIVGGPTHIRHMTTDFSRKRQAAGKVRKPKGEPRTSSNLMRRDRVCANGSTSCLGPKRGQGRRAAAPCRSIRHSPRLRAGRRRLWDCP
jgi:hypothetical protein